MIVRPKFAQYLTRSSVAVCFIIALALRLYRLGAQSLWLDEGGTWAEVSGRTGKSWWTLITELWSKDAAYPLYHLLLKAWVTFAGDSEWALRFPSAVAGAGAVAALYLAAREAQGHQDTSHHVGFFTWSSRHLVILLLAATSPFALWYAQDAKVYSLLMFVIALLVWAMLRAVRHNTAHAWLLVIAIAAVSVFVHRLALLALAGAVLAAALTFARQGDGQIRKQGDRKTGRDAFTQFFSLFPLLLVLLTLSLGGAGVYGVARALRGTTAGASGHVAAGPLLGLWLTLAHFSVDRGNIAGWLGVPLLVWVLPCLALTLWGGALLIRAALRRDAAAIVVLCMVVVPVALLVIALAITPIYEARYATIAFPAWVLVLAWPFLGDRQPPTADRRVFTGSWFLVLGLLLVNAAVLFQPQHGQFSGAPVKEQWRETITDIAQRAHPDDLLLIQPYYVKPMWDYYASRVTVDPLPEPKTFPIFAEGDTCIANPTPTQLSECKRRRHEPYFNEFAKGKTRALLLIAPDHAATVDPPKTLAELLDDCKQKPTPACKQSPPTKPDIYGFVGLRFQHATEQQTWPCGGATFVGVQTMCASFPAPFDVTQGARPQPPAPQIALEAIFGGEIKLRGYSLDLFDGKAQPGGTLPITLYWESVKNSSQQYTMFLHLCRDCESPPLASTDGPPLNGYAPAGDTRTWRGYPVHDERTLLLPANLVPGRYTLILGVYPAGQPGEAQRLSIVTSLTALPRNRLVLGEVTVSAAKMTR